MDSTEIRLQSYCYENPGNNEKLYQEIILYKFNPDLLLKISNLLNTQGWVFRGQADEEWALKTKFERFLEYHSIPLNSSDARTINKVLNIEKNSVKEFQRSLNLYNTESNISAAQEVDNYIEWVSLLGYYGGKTRLIDITRKFFVGLYFAAKELPDNNAALWCFNKNRILLGKTKSRKNNEEFCREISLEGYEKSNTDYINRVIRKELNAVQGLTFYEPFRRNQRMNAQESSYLVPLNISNSFETNLIFELFNGKANKSFLNRFEYLTPDKAYFGLKFNDFIEQVNDFKVLKIVIDKSIKKEILNFLDSVNINEKNLFSDMRGAASHAALAALNFENIKEKNQCMDEIKLIEIEKNVQNLQNEYYKEKTKEKKNEVINKIYKTIPDMSGLYKSDRSPEKSLAYYKFLLAQFKEIDSVDSLVYLKERGSKLLAEEITCSVRDLYIETDDLKEAYKYGLENYLLCVNLYGQYDFKTESSKEKLIKLEEKLEESGVSVDEPPDLDDSSWVFLENQQ